MNKYTIMIVKFNSTHSRLREFTQDSINENKFSAPYTGEDYLLKEYTQDRLLSVYFNGGPHLHLGQLFYTDDNNISYYITRFNTTGSIVEVYVTSYNNFDNYKLFS